MSYTREERERIAENIMRYREDGIIHSCEQRVLDLASGKLELPMDELARPATTWDLQWLEVVARDVLGLVNHDTHPLELRTGHQSRIERIK